MSVFKVTRITNGKVRQYWYCQLRDENGKVHTRSAGSINKSTKTRARMLEEKMLKEIESGEINARPVTISEFIPEFINYLINTKKNRAIKDVEITLRAFSGVYGYRQLTSIIPIDIEDFKERLRNESKAPATIQKRLAQISSMFTWAIKTSRYFKLNPVSLAGNVKVNNRRERVATWNEIRLLLNNADEPLRSFIELALNNGMRLNEIRTLTWENVNLEVDQMIIPVEVSKSKKREVKIMSEATRAILKQWKLRSGGSPYVFFPDPHAVQAATTFSTKFKSLCEMLNIADLHFHDLRHTAATQLSEAGFDIVAIKEFLGHANITTTMRYMHPREITKTAIKHLGELIEEKLLGHHFEQPDKV